MLTTTQQSTHVQGGSDGRRPYTFFADPGHGWLEVSLKELRDLNLLESISVYSYVHQGKAYLEEDCDLSRFFVAKGWTAWPEDLITTVHQDPTPIRNYAHFRPQYIPNF